MSAWGQRRTGALHLQRPLFPRKRILIGGSRVSATPTVARPDRLGAILDEMKAAERGDGGERSHRDRPAIKMNRKNRLRAGRERGEDGFDRQTPAYRINVHDNGPSAAVHDGIDRRSKGEVRNDHLVAGANAEPGQSEMQGCHSVADGHPMAATDEGGKSLLQSADILAAARNPTRKKCIEGKAELD